MKIAKGGRPAKVLNETEVTKLVIVLRGYL